jgi:hypothetical protein
MTASSHDGRSPKDGGGTSRRELRDVGMRRADHGGVARAGFSARAASFASWLWHTSQWAATPSVASLAGPALTNGRTHASAIMAMGVPFRLPVRVGSTQRADLIVHTTKKRFHLVPVPTDAAVELPILNGLRPTDDLV